MNFANYNLGIICGGGALPEVFINELKSNKDYSNINFYIVGFPKYTSKKLKRYATKFWLATNWSLTEIINFFKTYDVNCTVLLGYLPHQLLLNENITKDHKTKELVYNLKTKTAMEFFSHLVEKFEQEKIKIEPIDKYIKHCFAEKGEINNLSLTEEEIENIKFGYTVAKRLSELDVGLTVVVKDKTVVAVEAIEGTDNCILRAKKYAGEGCYVIKVARPNQDMRFDLPVIGPKTIDVLHRVKAKVLAVESEKTLILYKQNVIEKSKRLGIKIYGI